MIIVYQVMSQINFNLTSLEIQICK